ncbi:hypothetical protein ASE89_17210 [Sphingomonas sp. Leaf30]|nr:hypothetical protein ASE89_17210 [Sphingomonas sp. Leaf30]
MLIAELGAFVVWVECVECVGGVDLSLRRPRMAGRWAFQNIGDGVGKGRHPPPSCIRMFTPLPYIA